MSESKEERLKAANARLAKAARAGTEAYQAWAEARRKVRAIEVEP